MMSYAASLLILIVSGPHGKHNSRRPQHTLLCLTALELSQLQFHTLLLLLEKILGKNQPTAFIVDYVYRHSA